MPAQVYLYLVIAVAFETFGSACLQASQQFTRLWPSLGVLVGFAGAFYFFVKVLKYLPLGLTYALWSGLGITLITFVGWTVFGQRIDLPGLLGIAMIIAGILVIHLFSQTAAH